MTADELIERAKRQLNAGQPQPHVWPGSEIDIGACVLQAVGELSDRVMRDNALRTLLQQDYIVTLDGAGEGDLLATTGSITANTGEALQEGVYIGVVRDADNNVLVPLAHYSDFLRPQPTVYAYYCLKDRKIATRAIGVAVNTPADIVSVNGPLTVTASFAPNEVDDFPLELHDQLVQTLVNLVSAKVMPANANPSTT
jgi:hypothetical protein